MSFRNLALLSLFFLLTVACSPSKDPNLPLGDGGTSGSATGGTPGAGGTAGATPGGATATAGTTGDGGSAGSPPGTTSLAAAYADYFPLGVAIEPGQLATVGDIVKVEFNHLTAENAMKAQSLQPQTGSFNWTNADMLADFARENGMKMTGHALVWHRQAPAWFFADLAPGNTADIETLKGRLQAHIDAVVPRYADVIDNWDVVNEAISDDGTKDYRDGAEGSQWFDVFGSEEYVYWAFKYAYDALEANEAGSAAGKLYYNDYNVNLKVDRIIAMLDAVRAQGVPVDGVGLQSHVRMDWPPIAEIRTTIEKLVTAGYKVKISELDMSLYNDYPAGAFEPAVEVAFDATLEQAQADAYAALFALYRDKKGDITSVTFWGIADPDSWLNNEPVAGRANYPLLWSGSLEPKAAYFAVRDF